MLAFLAYDLVLIVLFLQHFERVEPALRLNLIVDVVVTKRSVQHPDDSVR